MAASKRHAVRDRHVRLGLFETGSLDDLAPDPRAVGLAGDSLDCEAEECETVVRVFVPRVRLDHRRILKVGHQLIDIRERTAILVIAGIGAIANNAGAV
jgi:hypothetical protein